jgi:asparagine synthase (glutamine-hydrolysing)
MCGICGVVARGDHPPISEPSLIAMRDSMYHRGPDDAGVHLGPGVALGSRRLAILDLSERGHMPMTSPDGRYWITYNGEVFNFPELRTALESRGHTFRSNTDTEVLLYLYMDEGPAMLDRLNGMYGIAIWDDQERELFLARDHAGIKPLYYALRGEAIYFASEPKALFAAGLPAEFDPGTWEELLCFRYIAGDRTPFIGVHRLLPGHYLLWKDGQVQFRRWWNLAERARRLRETVPEDPLQWFADMFDSAVNLTRISDVPVGVSLSGGLDSGSVAASLALQAGSGAESFTVCFEEDGFNEGPRARQVADLWHLQHHEISVSATELMARLEQASWFFNEPLAHGNEVHTLVLSEYAKRHVTVLLLGEGSDETLGGYVRYRPLRYPGWLKAGRPLLSGLTSTFPISGRLDKLNRFLDLGSLELFLLYNTCDVLPADLEALGMQPSGDFPFRQQVLEEARSLYPKDLMRQAMYNDQHTFLVGLLDRNDRMTMGASIEARVPFLDPRLMEGLAALPSSVLLRGRRGKELLRQSLGNRLPPAVRRHPKWGFGTPWRRWFREVAQFRELANELPTLSPIRDGPFRRKELERVVRAFLEGENRYELLVRQLMMIVIWHRACCARR